MILDRGRRRDPKIAVVRSNLVRGQHRPAETGKESPLERSVESATNWKGKSGVGLMRAARSRDRGDRPVNRRCGTQVIASDRTSVGDRDRVGAAARWRSGAAPI